DHVTVHVGVRIKGGSAGTVEEVTADGKVHGVAAPVRSRHVNKILAVVHDHHLGAILHSEDHAALGGNGGLNDLLRAIGLHQDRHSTGSDILHRHLHLGSGSTSGQVNSNHRGHSLAVSHR